MFFYNIHSEFDSRFTKIVLEAKIGGKMKYTEGEIA